MRPRELLYTIRKRSDCLKSSRRSEKETEVRGDEEIRRSSDLDLDSLDWAPSSSEERKTVVENSDLFWSNIVLILSMLTISKRLMILVKSCC